MNYRRSLTFNLRIRGLSEAEIAETLKEVRAHEAAAGTPAEIEFGKAEEYAKQFPKKKRRTRGTLITIIGGALAIAYLLLSILLRILAKNDVIAFTGPIELLPSLVLVLGGTLAGFLTDYFQPAHPPRTAR